MRRRGLAGLMAVVMALAVGICTVAAAEEFSVNAIRGAEAFAKGLGVPFDPQTQLENFKGSERFINSMGGDIFPDIMALSVNSQREFRRTLPSIFSYSQTAHYQDRADSGFVSDGALANFATENYYTYCPATMCSPGSKWVMWDVPIFTKETHKSDEGRLGYEQSVSGFSTGISRMIGESSAIGLAVGYDRRKLKGRDDYQMENRGNTLHLALYGGTNIGCFFFDGYAGFSRTWNKTKRRTDTSAVTGYLGDDVYGRARPHDSVLSAGLKGSYVWILGNDMRLTPSLGVDFSHVRMGASTEEGMDGTLHTAGGLMSVEKSDFTSVAMPMMISLNKTYRSGFLRFKGNDSLWTPEVRGGYVQQFGSKYATADVKYINTGLGNNAPSFTAESAEFNKSYGTVGAGVKIKLADKFIFNIDYDFSFASNWKHHSLMGMYGVSF